jgi:hypothetical protein
MQARAAGKARVAVKQARPGINHSKQEPGVRKQGNLCLVTVKQGVCSAKKAVGSDEKH